MSRSTAASRGWASTRPGTANDSTGQRQTAAGSNGQRRTAQRRTAKRRTATDSTATDSKGRDKRGAATFVSANGDVAEQTRHSQLKRSPFAGVAAARANTTAAHSSCRSPCLALREAPSLDLAFARLEFVAVCTRLGCEARLELCRALGSACATGGHGADSREGPGRAARTVSHHSVTQPTQTCAHACAHGTASVRDRRDKPTSLNGDWR